MTQVPTLEEATKAFDERAELAIRRSVERPEDSEVAAAVSASDRWGLVWFAASHANEIIPWGQSPTYRDAQLRQFLQSEPFALSAMGTIVAKYSAYSFRIDGPTRAKNYTHNLCHQANWGRGWLAFTSELAWDYLWSDKGAFVEIVREGDSPNSRIVGLKTLESLRCFPTGDPEVPVIYQSRVDGLWHRLKYYQVYQLQELPVAHEDWPGLQMSAATRMLRVAQIWKNILEYEAEKTGGRHTRSLTMISGVPKQAVTDAMNEAQSLADQRLLNRYGLPAIVSSEDPQAKVDAKVIDFNGPPESFNREEWFKEMLTLYAMALLTDYQELAPLPGGGLGTGNQSVILDKKAAQRGAALFRKSMEHFMNQVVVPDSCEFQYDEEDLDEEQLQATVRKTRAETRGLMVQNGEVDAAGSRQLALDDGDMPEELFLEMNERDLTEQAIRDDERAKVETETTRRLRAAGLEDPAAPQGDTPNVVGVGGFGSGGPAGDEENAQQATKAIVRYLTKGIGNKEQELAAFLQTRIHRAFTTAADDLAAMGYLDTAERIKLSSIIGESLRTFSSLVDAGAADVALRRIGDADIETLLALGSKQVEQERLDAEEDATGLIEKPLTELFANIRRELGAMAE